MKVHIFELRRMIWRYEWSSQLCTQLKQLWNESLKKIQAWRGFEPMTSAIPVQCSPNWAIKPYRRLKSDRSRQQSPRAVLVREKTLLRVVAHLPSVGSLEVGKRELVLDFKHISCIDRHVFPRASSIRTPPTMHCDHDHLLRTDFSRLIFHKFFDTESSDGLEHRSVIQVMLILFQIGIISGQADVRRAARWAEGLICQPYL